MVQTTNRFFDEVARLMNDAAGVAQGVRREFETLFRTQAERILRDLDVVKREEFEAVKDMARLAREENEALKARIAALEAALAQTRHGSGGQPVQPRRAGSRPMPSWSARFGRARHRLGLGRSASLFFGLCAAISAPPRLLQHPWRLPRNSNALPIGFNDKDIIMATVNLIKATARSRAGKGAARAERRAGRVPGIIYGDGKPPLPISLDYAELRQRIYAGHFLTTIHDVEIDGVKHRVIPRDFQLDAVRDLPLHVDFMRLGEGATIRVNIPIHVKNAEQSPGVKRGGTRQHRHPHASRCAAAPTPSRPASRSMSASSRSITPGI